MFKHISRASLALLAASGVAAAASGDFGTPTRPFAADSLWNSRPVDPVFGTYVIPESRFYPAIGAGAYSTGVFVSSDGDPAVEVGGAKGKAGVAEADTGAMRVISIPHWPAGVTAASGSDAHADLIDPSAGIIHSFWQLRQQDGRWTAALYAWSRLDGRGWGDPAHYYQGARASGVPTSAGLIRAGEINDGDPVYHHALAMSLTYNALAADPAYIFPATAADNNAAGTNTGAIPQGALLMLPPNFDTTHIDSPALRKVADTLKLYGAYVVDRNDGTPFYIYAENGSGFKLSAMSGWNQKIANELQRIRAGLRQVVSAKNWVDGNGKTFTPTSRLSLITMQGHWRGADSGRYDPQSDAVSFPAAEQPQRLVNLGLFDPYRIRWAAPAPGAPCKLSVHASGGAKLRLLMRSMDYANVLYDSGELNDGATPQFPCPASRARTELQAIGGAGQASTVRADLYADPVATH